MKANTYVCTNCKTVVELSTKPKRSFMGFFRIQCPECKKEFRYPLTTGYEVVYWLLLIGNVLWISSIVARGNTVIPNPVGIVVLVYVIVSLLKSSQLKRQIAELDAEVKGTAPHGSGTTAK